jgi:hypothetical protein
VRHTLRASASMTFGSPRMEMQRLVYHVEVGKLVSTYDDGDNPPLCVVEIVRGITETRPCRKSIL